MLDPGDPSDPSDPSDPHAPTTPTTPTAGQSPTDQKRSHSRFCKPNQHELPSSPRHCRHSPFQHVQPTQNFQRSPSAQQGNTGPIHYSRNHLNDHSVDKPLPPPPNVSASPKPLGNLHTLNTPNNLDTPNTPTTTPKLTLRSRFNTDPAPTSGKLPHPERQPIKIPASQHVAAEVSLKARSSGFPREKPSQYHSTTGDLWPILDTTLHTGTSRTHQPGSSCTRAQDSSADHPLAVNLQRSEQRASCGVTQGPSDYELFIRRAQEQDRHYREQLLRFLPGRLKDDSQKAKKYRSAAHVFSWQRTATKRQQQEQDVRRSWQAGEQARQNPATASRRNSDNGPFTSGGLRRKGSRSSLSSIKQAIAHYIKPPRPPSAHDE